MPAKAKGELIFSIVLLVYCLSFVFFSFELKSLSRRFPLIVTAVMIVFLIIKIVGILKKTRRLEKENNHTVSGGDKSEAFTPWLDAYPTILWVVGLLVGFYFFGLVIGGIIFTFLFVKFWGKESIRTSLLSTLVALLLVYVLFGIVMKFQIFGGLLQIKLPFIFNT